MKKWQKIFFINSIKDILNCFRENASFDKKNNYIFENLTISANCWKLIYNTIANNNWNLKNYNYFEFSFTLKYSIRCFRYAFKINRESGEVEYGSTQITTIVAQIKKKEIKQIPKYSKVYKVLNSDSLTNADENLLRKKALQWKLALPSK